VHTQEFSEGGGLDSYSLEQGLEFEAKLCWELSAQGTGTDKTAENAQMCGDIGTTQSGECGHTVCLG